MFSRFALVAGGDARAPIEVSRENCEVNCPVLECNDPRSR